MSKSTTRWRYAQHELSPTGKLPCHYCGVQLSINHSTVDHKIPKAAGGRNWSTNYLIACKTCNGLRGDMPYEEFKLKWKEMRDAVDPRTIPSTGPITKPKPRVTPRKAFQKTIGLYRRPADETQEWSAPCFPTKG